MVGIIDYGVGNLFSIKSSLAYLGIECKVVHTAEEINSCDRLILPGVGAFGDASKALCDSGLDNVIKEYARGGRPLLGICLGMQLLFEKGLEFGEFEGLGLIPGTVVAIEPVVNGNKVPHIGWNKLIFNKNIGDVYKNTRDGDCVYFVHSYHAECPDEFITARTEYGGVLTASVQNGNVIGAQYHPEKSGDVGLGILKSFCEF